MSLSKLTDLCNSKELSKLFLLPCNLFPKSCFLFLAVEAEKYWAKAYQIVLSMPSHLEINEIKLPI